MSETAGTILVVDDVPQNVRLLEAVLEPRGFEVVSAADGPAALALVESADPDLVLLDVVMPEMDGYAVCRRIRAREETAVLPVIMVTSSGGQEKRQAIDAGADDFVQKPFDQHELLTRVRSLLRIKRYHDTISAQAAQLLDLNRTLEERVRRSSTSSSGCSAFADSSHLSSARRSSPRETTRSSPATGARSRCSSPTSAAGRASSTRSSRRS